NQGTRAEVLQLMTKAREAIKVGNFAAASLLAEEAKNKRTALLPGDDTPEAIFFEIDRITKGSSLSSAAPPSSSMPSAIGVPSVTPPDRRDTGAIDPAKARAQQLLAEGRQLEKAGKLLEAWQKCRQAQDLGASFSTGEDNPTQAVQQLTKAAQQRI